VLDSQVKVACASTRSGPLVQIERVMYTPQKEVYYPGEVLYVGVLFAKPFVGECAIGLARKDGAELRSTPCRLSTTRLYEGQVYIAEDHVGSCILEAALTPVGGKQVRVATTDRIFQVQALRP
jgi:hypothetical protein